MQLRASADMIQNAFRCTHPSQTPWRSPIGMCCTKQLYTSMPLDQKWAKQNIRKSSDRSVFGDCRRFRDYCEHAGGRPICSHSGLNIRIGLGEGGGIIRKIRHPKERYWQMFTGPYSFWLSLAANRNSFVIFVTYWCIPPPDVLGTRPCLAESIVLPGTK